MTNIIQKDNTNRMIDFLCKKRGRSATLTEIATGVPYIGAKERKKLLKSLVKSDIVKEKTIYHGGPNGTQFKRQEYCINYKKVFA